MARGLGVPVGYDTDVNAACLGEVTFGSAKGLDVMVYLTVGTGNIERRWGKPGRELADVQRVWELESEYLAEGLVTYIMCYSPQRIVLGGGVMKQPQLFGLVREKVARG